MTFMARCWPFLTLLGVILSFLRPSPARGEKSWILIGPQDGLLGQTIHSLCPTASGGVFAGTSYGLSYWDGQRWVSYGPGNGLPEGDISAVAEDQGVIWVGSWGGGLGCLRGASWRRYLSSDSPLPSDWVTDLLPDKGGLWIATYGHGLAYLKDDFWTTFTRENSALPSDWLSCLIGDKAGGIWIGTERSGLVHRDAEGRWQAYELPDAEQVEVTDLAWRGRQLWVGTRRGVAILDPHTGSWRTLGPDQGLPSWHVTALAALPDGRMWVGTDQGLALWDEGKMRIFTVRDGLPHDYVSALAVDLQGRTWVGSYIRGLAVLGELAPPKIARPPVVLVHGWRGPESELLEDSEFWHLARWLREDGFEPYYATGISPKKTLHANAARLREVIAQARRESGADGIYVIAFSMGGLNARAYLESTLYQGDVLRAFILGTPHRGEEMWLPFLLWEYLAWTDEPSALELLPAHAELFNHSHGNVWGVPYTIIAGDATISDLPVLFRELVPSDGLVSTWSALGAKGPGVDQRVTRDVHAWSEDTILMNIPSLLFPRTTYDAHIRPYLLGVANAPGTSSPLSAQGYEQPLLEPRSALRTGVVKPGEKVTLEPIPIEAPGRTRFYVRWKGAPLSVSLHDPHGRFIDPKVAEDDDRSEYLELDFADFAGYVLTNTLPGPWSIVLEADSKNRSSSQYVAYASISSTVRLEVRTDRTWYRPGEEVIISATLTPSDMPITLNEVQAEIYSPSKQPTRLHLRPHPTNAKEETSPVYAGRYRIPPEGGYYVLLARAQGAYAQKDLERGEAVTFGVYGDGARLSGYYQLALGQPHAKGYLESLEATIGLAVKREGDYLCSVILTDGAGRQVATIAHPMHLSSGTHIVNITIPGRAIAASHSQGPYRLGEVILADISGAAVLLDIAKDVGPTILARPSDFVGASALKR